MKPDSRRFFIKKAGIGFATFSFRNIPGLFAKTKKENNRVFFTTGCKTAEVTPENDFTVKLPFENLEPDTTYQILWEAKPTKKGKTSTHSNRFNTSPAEQAEKSIQLVTPTCQYFWSHDDAERGFKTYDSMARLNPDFFLQTGDYVYYDKPGPRSGIFTKKRLSISSKTTTTCSTTTAARLPRPTAN